MPPAKKPVETISPRRRTASRKTMRTTKAFDPTPPVEIEEEPVPMTEQIPSEPIVKPVETVTFRATHFYAVLVVLAFAVGILVGYMAWGRTPAAALVPQQPVAQGPSVEQPTAAAPSGTPQYVRYKVPTDGFPSIGPADAPITLVEFADFQCPYCRQWEQQTYQPLLQAYPGKIRFVFRDFPLTSIHPNAMPSAEAAQCANEQGKFWEFHDKLFGSETLSPDVYTQYAQGIGLDMTKFNDCVSSHKYAQAIQDDSNFAINLGVNSTPTFFINGLALIGAQPLTAFTNVIDKELAGQIPK